MDKIYVNDLDLFFEFFYGIFDKIINFIQNNTTVLQFVTIPIFTLAIYYLISFLFDIRYSLSDFNPNTDKTFTKMLRGRVLEYRKERKKQEKEQEKNKNIKNYIINDKGKVIGVMFDKKQGDYYKGKQLQKEYYQDENKRKKEEKVKLHNKYKSFDIEVED